MEKRSYQGNCINSFDEDRDCLLNLFTDVSDFAYVDENSEEIDQRDFFKECSLEGLDLPNQEVIYLLFQELGRVIYMIYDPEDDIHYFFD